MYLWCQWRGLLLPKFFFWFIINKRLVLCLADPLSERDTAHALACFLMNLIMRL